MISVIIPVYNNQNTLQSCLKSVDNQTFENLEVVVVDDGSSYFDKTKSVVSEFKNIKLVKQENQGAPAARNRGFRESKGDFVIFLDADIVLKPDALAQMHSKLITSKEAYCYSAYRRGWKKYRFINFDLELLKKINYIHTSSLIKRSVFPGFDEGLKKFQDWDLWLTLAENNYFGIGINKILFKIIDTHGTMSRWYPKFFYKINWPVLGFTPKMIKKYYQAKEIIKAKHNL